MTNSRAGSGGGSSRRSFKRATTHRAFAFTIASSFASVVVAGAYEAASMHYLVDKHCAGHGIDKLAIKKAWSANHPILDQVSHRIGTGAAVKIIHDLGNDGGPNQAGVDVHNRAGETWPEFGDASFGRPLNAESRRRTAESIYTSYDELEAVRTGKKTLEEVQRAGYGINETVPQFDPAFQQAMEEETKDIGVRRIVDTLGTKENFGLLGQPRWPTKPEPRVPWGGLAVPSAGDERPSIQA